MKNVLILQPSNSATKPGDGEQLRHELLEKTLVVVKDMRQYTSLDSLNTLTDLVAKLRYGLKERCVRNAVQIENLLHFVEFEHKETENVNFRFGQRFLCPISVFVKSSSNKAKTSFASAATKYICNATATLQ